MLALLVLAIFALSVFLVGGFLYFIFMLGIRDLYQGREEQERRDRRLDLIRARHAQS